jgi:transcriptional regulator with XRE-family HTH domain
MARTKPDNEVGKRIGVVARRWRKEFGWDQKKLAAESGQTQTYISKFELGQSGDPGVSRVMVICAAFRRSPCELLHAAGLLTWPRPPIETLEDMATILGSLSEEGQAAVLDYLHMVQSKEEHERADRNDGDSPSDSDLDQDEGERITNRKPRVSLRSRTERHVAATVGEMQHEAQSRVLSPGLGSSLPILE